MVTTTYSIDPPQEIIYDPCRAICNTPPEDIKMTYSHMVGFLDGKTMIEMNNLSVGYFPTSTPEIGVYPLPTVEQQRTVTLEPGVPVVPAVSAGQSSGTNS